MKNIMHCFMINTKTIMGMYFILGRKYRSQACIRADGLFGLTQCRIRRKRQLKWRDYISLELFNK